MRDFTNGCRKFRFVLFWGMYVCVCVAQVNIWAGVPVHPPTEARAGHGYLCLSLPYCLEKGVSCLVRSSVWVRLVPNKFSALQCMPSSCWLLGIHTAVSLLTVVFPNPKPPPF